MSPTQPYTAEIRDHLDHPRNQGELQEANGTGSDENPVCGDVMTVWLQIEDRLISRATFEARGCGPSLASGSVTTELVAGRALEDAKHLTPEEVDRALGGVPNLKRHAPVLAVTALRNAIADFERKAGEW